MYNQNMRIRFPIILAIVFVFALWVILQVWVSLYPTLLWFDHLGFASVFWTTLSAKAFTAATFGFLFLVIAAVNVYLARFLGREKRKELHYRRPPDIQKMIRELFGEGEGEKKEEGEEEGTIDITPPGPEEERRVNLYWGIGILILSLFMSLSAITQWEVILKALNAVSFGIADPIFGRDLGFYVFNFPLQKFIQGFLFSAVLLSLLGTLWIYLRDGNISFSNFGLSFGRGVKTHLAVVLAVLALLFAWGLWLGELGVLYSERGVAFGAGYTDVKAQILGYNLQILMLIILAGLLMINIFQKDFRLPLAGIAAYLLIAILMGGLYPAFIQNFQVKPNEITLEAPYIAHNIKYTRRAFNLEDVKEKDFSAEQKLSPADIQRNRETIDNIRLWDPHPLLKTYPQLQEIRLYYDFSDVDIDRYQINGKYQQVMLSAREMNVSQLPEKAQTWVNRHLKFTHGYGAVLSPAREQTSQGLPTLLIKDIPPVTQTNLKIERPEIYYGEETDNYVIVKTEEEEFDYPKGDRNIYATYKGRGGVKIGSFWRKLLFALSFSELKILLTGYITPESRIMFNRSIQKRVTTIAPYLSYDRDPYLVISDGKLYFIQDAYTTSDLYPYSDPTGAGLNRFNYIRNSVKVVVDAYHGDVTFYIVDDKDPIIRTYQKIFPGLFRPFSEMPAGLVKHLRYPYDLFMIQANKYAAYHMRDPQVFYNQEDLWNIPREIYESREQPMDAYYIIMKLPGEAKEEFLLMLPFTPNRKDNMIAWMAARCDMPNYGRLLVYKFPKEKLIYGPMQIEARIDQQTEISQQFTLWGQRGSRVLRGNLLAIPIEESILYVEPIYLEAEAGALPELKRVIAAHGLNISMAETLEEALSSVLAGRILPRPVEAEIPNKRALELYNQVGEKLRELGKVLQQLNR